MKILIVKLSSLGDVVHTLPALHALKRGIPGASIDWIVESAASGIIKDDPSIDEVIVVRRNAWLGSPSENLSVTRHLRSKGYDLVIDFQGLFKSGLWVFLSGGKRKLGFSNSRELSSKFYNEKMPPYDPELHAVDRYLKLAEFAGGDISEIDSSIATSSAVTKKVIDLLALFNLSEGTPFVTILPMARWGTKMWGAERFARLAKEIRERFGLTVVLSGSSADRAELEEIRKWAGEGVIDLAGKTDLKELAALLKISTMAVTVDSGPMHIAAAVGTPLVALFGPTSPGRTGPYGKNSVVIRKGHECSPCFKRSCNDPKCMTDITVDDVIAKMVGLMGEGGANKAATATNS